MCALQIWIEGKQVKIFINKKKRKKKKRSKIHGKNNSNKNFGLLNRQRDKTDYLFEIGKKKRYNRQ